MIMMVMMHDFKRVMVHEMVIHIDVKSVAVAYV